MKESSYFLLENSLSEFIEEFYKDSPYLETIYKMEGDIFFDKEIEKINKKYTTIQREYLLKQLKEQAKINNSWYVRQLAIFAILVAIAIFFANLKLEILQILSYVTMAGTIINLFFMDKKFVRRNNRILRVISIFDFIDKFEKK